MGTPIIIPPIEVDVENRKFIESIYFLQWKVQLRKQGIDYFINWGTVCICLLLERQNMYDMYIEVYPLSIILKATSY